jgi:inositol-hexakisphosphate 5-kinase
MDKTTTGLLSQSTQLTLSKFHNNESTNQLSSIFQVPTKKQNPIESVSDNNRNGLNCSGSSTPKKSISSSNPLNEFLKPHSILSQNNSSESDDDEDSKKDEINLYPLSNQVGGHTRLLLLNDKTVIKPLNVRELEFYQNIPGNDIQHFVPNYKGERLLPISSKSHFCVEMFVSKVKMHE